jgi:GNAT superfamily N-acetyltransferase
MQHPLVATLADAALGRFPPADGVVEVVRSPAPYRAAVVAFTAHSIIAADLPKDEVLAHLPDDDLGAPMSPSFLVWLSERVGSRPGNLDVVLAHIGVCESPLSLAPVADNDHPRVMRAREHRRGVAVYTDPQAHGVATLGRGLVDRWEISLELNPASRGRGLGRAMISSARALLPAEEPVFAQVSPGNALSLRAFLASGFRPIGSEVLFL